MEARTQASAQRAELSVERTDGVVLIHVSGVWHLHRDLPPMTAVVSAFESGRPQKVAFECGGLSRWDSSLLVLIAKVTALCRERGVAEDRSGLPPGLARLLELTETAPEKEGAAAAVAAAAPGFVAGVGEEFLGFAGGLRDFVRFFGEVAIAFGRLSQGRARFRRGDLMLEIQQCGAQAFGIVTLISFLVGVILAFMGAVQLEWFGASIYVADLVSIGVARDMGAMMTAIIMAGRTGAAFAAQLGTMKVTQEIDALTTMGVSPIEFLVLPRVLALVLMMPLLCLYSDFMGVLGGAAVGAGMLGISLDMFFQEVIHAVHLGDIVGGVVKATVYGIIVAISGCMRGFQCGDSSSAVGEAATAAVVTGIVYIVVACGLFAVIFHIMGF